MFSKSFTASFLLACLILVSQVQGECPEGSGTDPSNPSACLPFEVSKYKDLPIECEDCSTNFLSYAKYYAKFFNQNVKSNKCPILCETCSSKTYCTKCISGFYPKDGECTLCSVGCETCNSETDCIQCQFGYHLDNGKCKRNPDNCKVFSDGACRECYSKYFVRDGICVSCGPNCDTCLSETECITCDRSYFSNKGICEKCGKGCYSCSSTTACDKCYDGFGNNNGICEPCGENCVTCDIPTKCTSCEKGFGYTPSGICEECKGICSECKAVDYCTRCSGNLHGVSSHNECAVRWWVILFLAGMILLFCAFIFCSVKYGKRRRNNYYGDHYTHSDYNQH